jgi:tRNA pseudouridine55 synthase
MTKWETVTAPFGILNVDKPSGITSRDAVDRVERLTQPAKCGHAGTLDPIATGVLVVCVGSATRLIQYVQQLPKHYRGTFLLGQRSATDDIEGEVELLDEAPQPTRAEIEATIPNFVGQIMQRPPAHSAIKVGGQRAYDLARRGEEFELPPRPITIHHIKVLEYQFPALSLEVVCGSGTYIRSLGRDLAAELGTAAVMSALVRTAIGPFALEDAVSLNGLNGDVLSAKLQPALAAVAHLPRVELNDKQLVELRHGRPIEMPRGGTGGPPVQPGTKAEVEYVGVDAAGRLAAILFEKLPGQLWPARNFETGSVSDT